MSDFYTTLSEESLQPVYILTGSEALLLDRAQEAIRNAAMSKDLRAFNLDQVEGRQTTASALMAGAQTLPMMATRRVLEVRELERLPSAELTKLIPYLEQPSASTVFVARCTKVDKRIKFFQKAKKLGFLHELSAPKRLEPWINSEAKTRGISLESGAAKRLGEVVGADLSRLGLALEQLSLYCNGNAIGVEAVEDLVSDTRERSVFELTNAISARSQVKAMQAVEALIEQRQSAIGVVMLLARHMRQIGLFQAGKAARLSRGELAKKVGAPPFALDRIADEASRYSVRAVAQAIRQLATADKSLKGLGGRNAVLGKSLSDRLILEETVSRLISLGTP